MKTLYEIYEEIANNVERWFYYTSLLENKTNNDTINNLRNNLINGVLHKDCDENEANRKAKEFSDTYFTIGGKGLLTSFFKDHIDSLQRGDHTLSVFLLGIRLAEMFKILPYGNKANEAKDPYEKDGFNFKYYWFLACLYHDVGYVYENSTYLDESIRDEQERKNKLQGDLVSVRTDGVEAVQEICDIQYLHSREFKTYSKAEVNLYLKGRATFGIESIDHGIVGGLLLYDKLRKQFETSWAKIALNNSSSRIDFWDNGLHLSNNHFEEYAKAANAIIAHNIWIETLNKYKQFVNMRLGEKNKLTYDKNDPLCFILCLADTLEPLKRLSDVMNAECILRNISLEFPRPQLKSIHINVKITNNDIWNCKAKEALKAYIKAILDMKNWLEGVSTLNDFDYKILDNNWDEIVLYIDVNRG